MEIGSIDEKALELSGKKRKAYVMEFDDLLVSGGMTLDFIRATHDPNEEVHKYIAAGFQTDVIIQNIINQMLFRREKSNYATSNYSARYPNPLPNDSIMHGKIYSYEKDGKLVFEPDLRYTDDNEKEVILTGEPLKNKGSKFEYQTKLSDETSIDNPSENPEKVGITSHRILPLAVKAFLKGTDINEIMYIDDNVRGEHHEYVPQSFAPALVSKALFESLGKHIKENFDNEPEKYFNGKKAIYTSREIKFFNQSRLLPYGSEIILSHEFKYVKNRITGKVAGHYNGHNLFECETSLLLAPPNRIKLPPLRSL